MKWQELKNNPQSRRNLEQRAKILQAIRQFFWQEGFLEMDTPLLVSQPALEVYLNHFETAVVDEKNHHFPAYLITSPEYSLKKILAAGFNKIFQLGKVFRNHEPWNQSHNPEFTLLEWYRTGVDYRGMMKDCEKLFLFLIEQLQNKSQIPNPPPISLREISRRETGDLPKGDKSQINPKNQNPKLNYQSLSIDLSPPWPRMSMREAWQKWAGVDLDKFLTREKMAKLARKKGYPVSAKDSFDDLFFKIFLSEIEPKFPLDRPLFLYDYPIQMAALSRQKKDDPRYAERFELYLGGWELANAYSELIDWREQESRFKQDQRKRGQLGKEVYNIDEDFIAALKAGLPACAGRPECAGAALGVDRLVMVLMDARSIDEVIPFAAAEIFK